MKRLIFIIIAIALVCIACNREKRNMHTRRGKEIHNSWYNATRQIINTDVIPAFHLDAWINAPNDSVRYLIEDQFFPYYKIRQEETNVYAIYNGPYKEFTVNTFGKSLGEDGSNWLVSKYNLQYLDLSYAIEGGVLPDVFYFYESEKIHISKNGDQWRFQMDSSENYGSYCDMNIKPLDNSDNILFNKEKYNLSGNGLFEYDDQVYLLFDIQKTILNDQLYYASGYYFIDGIVQLMAQQENSDDIHVKAEYRSNSQIAITYRNVTEYWNVESN